MIEKIENVIKILRWKVFYFISNNSNSNNKNNQKFENDVLNIINKIERTIINFKNNHLMRLI